MFVSCFMIILSELPFFEAHSLGGPKLLMPCWGQATSYMHFVMQWMHMNPKVQLILILKSLNYPNITRKEHTKTTPNQQFMFPNSFHVVMKGDSWGMLQGNVWMKFATCEVYIFEDSTFVAAKSFTTHIAGLWLFCQLAKNMLSYSEGVWGCCCFCIPRGWTSSTDSVTHVFFGGSCFEKNSVFWYLS